MGDVLPFPDRFDRSTVAQLKRDNCSFRVDVTVDPETALELLTALGRLDVSIVKGSITIVRPDRLK